MAVSATRHDPLRGFKYKVTVVTPAGDHVQIGAQRVSGLREENEITEYRDGDEQGGVRKLPGLPTYDNITIERGARLSDVTGGQALLEWRRVIQQAETDGSEDENAIRGSLQIEIFRRGKSADAPADYTYNFTEVWPVVYEHSDLDGTSSDVWMERVEFAVERAAQGFLSQTQ